MKYDRFAKPTGLLISELGDAVCHVAVESFLATAEKKCDGVWTLKWARSRKISYVAERAKESTLQARICKTLGMLQVAVEQEIVSPGTDSGNEHMISNLLEIRLFHLYEGYLSAPAFTCDVGDAGDGEQLYDLLFVTIAFLAFAAIEEHDDADADY